MVCGIVCVVARDEVFSNRRYSKVMLCTLGGGLVATVDRNSSKVQLYMVHLSSIATTHVHVTTKD